MIEKEKLDETLLIKSIEELNKNYKSYITKENFPLKKERENILNIQGGEINDKLKTKRSHSVFCGSYDNDFNFLSLHEKESTCATNYLANNLSPCLNNSNSTGANTFLFHNEELPISSVDTFISQNVISFDAIVKLIVIGDKAVGKSLFTERCLSSDIVLDGIYNPTERYED